MKWDAYANRCRPGSREFVLGSHSLNHLQSLSMAASSHSLSPTSPVPRTIIVRVCQSRWGHLHLLCFKDTEEIKCTHWYKRWKNYQRWHGKHAACTASCITASHCARNPFHSSSYPNMDSVLNLHRLWPESHLSVKEGQGRATSSSAPSCCVLRAGRCTKPAGCGQSCRSLRLEMTRRREIPQIHWRAGKPDCKLLTSATEPFLLWAECLWGRAQTVWDAQSTSVRAKSLDPSDTWWTSIFLVQT